MKCVSVRLQATLLCRAACTPVPTCHWATWILPHSPSTLCTTHTKVRHWHRAKQWLSFGARPLLSCGYLHDKEVLLAVAVNLLGDLCRTFRITLSAFCSYFIYLFGSSLIFKVAQFYFLQHFELFLILLQFCFQSSQDFTFLNI